MLMRWFYPSFRFFFLFHQKRRRRRYKFAVRAWEIRFSKINSPGIPKASESTDTWNAKGRKWLGTIRTTWISVFEKISPIVLIYRYDFFFSWREEILRQVRLFKKKMEFERTARVYKKKIELLLLKFVLSFEKEQMKYKNRFCFSKYEV